MKGKDLKFRAHEYTGRENGMMVIGTTTQIQKLSELLTSPATFVSPEWPSKITSINIGSESSPYVLSFHLENNTNIPLQNVPRSPKLFWVLAIMLPLAIIGVITIIGWVKNAL